ncbi:helix-turn-helix domain-containing protein [Treponema brennaborense]|uniref:Helix-turn-helix domain protein n=1 Tax=Treponema brennaborense (strain DSM 12168 / CIP 105900 / DD5/3) TaxID=906968 RepID=F4LP02_TREBD|nr:helix-turn-helix transcriptional regulator [Treponema brennaborense]AEE17979.1 helix-turn-helix domain protein [Treponema brennaborense DSM 12168]
METISIGKKIAELRKAKGLTQDELSEQLNVSPQAVSKWENDVSYPDITLLPKLAAVLGVTVDDLLTPGKQPETKLVPQADRKNVDDMMFKVVVNSVKGDKVRVNLPVPLIKMALEMGVAVPQIAGNEYLQKIDFAQILLMLDKGIIGKLVEVESAEGDIVEVVVE